VPDRERQIALEPFHRFVQLGVDLIWRWALRLQHALQNVDQFRELVFHDVLGLGLGQRRNQLCHVVPKSQ
jgi:hypothetical protein